MHFSLCEVAHMTRFCKSFTACVFANIKDCTEDTSTFDAREEDALLTEVLLLLLLLIFVLFVEVNNVEVDGDDEDILLLLLLLLLRGEALINDGLAARLIPPTTTLLLSKPVFTRVCGVEYSGECGCSRSSLVFFFSSSSLFVRIIFAGRGDFFFTEE